MTDSQASHIQVPSPIVELFTELETKVRTAAIEFNDTLGALQMVRQELEDSAVQAKLASDRLGDEAIARMKAEFSGQMTAPVLATYQLAVELAARQVLEVCWSPRGYADPQTADAMKLLRDTIHKLDLAKQDANRASAVPDPL